jgi:hypothetical protein
MTAPDKAPPVELVDAAVNAWFAETPRAALIRDSHEHFRERMRAALAAVGFPAPAAGDARDAGHEALGAAIMRAARDLPENFEISLHLEQGYGGATLTYPDGDSVELDSADERNLAKEINEGIDAAIAASQQGGE